MANTSATGGYLQPAQQPEYGDALDDIFQAALANLSGLPGARVRPRWQERPPKSPAISTDWAAIGVTEIVVDEGPAFVHDPASGANGETRLIRHETLTVTATFYGPNSMGLASLVRDNISLNQNVETLNASGVYFVKADDVTAQPELYNEQWIRRFDLVMTFRRKVEMVYVVETIVDAPITITAQNGDTRKIT